MAEAALFPRRGRDLPVAGVVREELANLIRPHLPGVGLAVEEDEAPDPLHVSLLGADAIMRESDLTAQAFKERG